MPQSAVPRRDTVQVLAVRCLPKTHCAAWLAGGHGRLAAPALHAAGRVRAAWIVFLRQSIGVDSVRRRAAARVEALYAQEAHGDEADDDDTDDVRAKRPRRGPESLSPPP